MLGDLVFPSSVEDLQNKLFNDFTALDHDVSVCTNLPTAVRTNWVTFVHTFEAWYNIDPNTFSGYWTAGELYDQGLQIQTQLIAWQAAISKAGCTLSEPAIAPPPIGINWDAAKTIVASIAVITVAIVTFPIVLEGVDTFRSYRESRTKKS
jgi:hypothetical protein